MPELAEVKNRVFDFTKSGAGPALVFIHGWPFHKETYRQLIPLMEPHFTCYNLNSLGMSHDGTGCDAEGMDFADHARRVLEFADAMGLERFSLLGHDTGGTVARLVAASDPARIDKLVLLNTEMPNHRPPFIPTYQRLFALPGSALVLKGMVKSKLYRHSALGFGGIFWDKQRIEGDFSEQSIRYFFDDAQRLEGMRQYLLGLKFNLIDTLDEVHARIKAPTQFIWGKNDKTFDVALGRKMAERMPSCDSFVEIEQCCFVPQEERPEEVAEHALRFLMAANTA